MSRASIDWTPLGGFDPAPGEPAAIAEAATTQRTLVGTAVDLATGAHRVAFEAGTGGWRGTASEAFVAAFASLPGVIEGLGEAAAAMAEALGSWEERLTGLQAEADGLLADAVAVHASLVTAEATAERAAGQVSAARWALNDVRREADEADDGDLWRAAARLDRAADARTRADAAVDDLRDELARLRLRAVALKGRHQLAAVRATWSSVRARPEPVELPDFLIRLVTGTAPTSVEAAADLLDLARLLELAPATYAQTLETYWVLRAAEAAGIDMAAWDPSLGARANADVIAAVYTYYGQLYAGNPDLRWAGMANMIGPSFAAGFFDLAFFREVARTLDDLPKPPGLLPAGLDAVARMSEEELRFFETTFLEMQRQIFLDQATMHQAYADGGMAAIREMEAAGLITPEILRAWADVDSGAPSRVDRGNERFLLQEQRDVIADDYLRMRSRPHTGEAMTWLMTLIGTPSIPGARGYPDVFPVVVTVETPGPRSFGFPGVSLGTPLGTLTMPRVSVDNPGQGEVHITTPLPDGNIAGFDDRWALIRDDTLPAFLDLLDNDPARAMAIITSDVEGRIDDYRLDQRIDDIIRDLVDFDVDFDQ